MRELALFAGGGGGILGGILLGWRTVCAVELDPYARDVLLARQRDGVLPRFPIWDDVRTFDGHRWRGHADVVSGGFPCQDISVAGKGAGIDGERSGLWAEFARIIGEVRPRYVLVENSPMLTVRGLGRVLGDLAALGFDAEGGVLGAHHVGAPHLRDRIWIVGRDPDGPDEGSEPRALERQDPEPRRDGLTADSDGAGGIYESITQSGRFCATELGGDGAPCSMADTTRTGGRPRPSRRRLRSTRPAQRTTDPDSSGRLEQRGAVPSRAQQPTTELRGWWASEPDVGRVAHGVAHRLDRLRAIGNGQVPAVAAFAFETLSARVGAYGPNGR